MKQYKKHSTNNTKLNKYKYTSWHFLSENAAQHVSEDLNIHKWHGWPLQDNELTNCMHQGSCLEANGSLASKKFPRIMWNPVHKYTLPVPILSQVNPLHTLMYYFFRICCNKFQVCKSLHHHTIQINQTTRCNNLSSLLLDVYVQLNMFRASSRPSSGAQQLQ